MNITLDEFYQLEQGTFLLVDTRDEDAYQHGCIPGAIRMDLQQDREKLPKDKKIILYCTRGERTVEMAEELENQGYAAYSLQGGYGAWLVDSFERSRAEQKQRCADIEKSIRKKFHKDIFSKFAKAIN